jgi:D-alanyl-D-alanine carboxypeptidase
MHLTVGKQPLIRRVILTAGVALGVLAVSALATPIAVQAITPHELTVPESFVHFASSPTLASPGIILIDPDTHATIFSDAADVSRAPASVLKLFSMATVLNTFAPDTTFSTSLNTTATPGTYVMLGQSDPWITSSQFEAKKYHRAFSPALINALLATHPHLKSIKLQYSGVYTQDAKNLQRYFAGHIHITLLPIASPNAAKASAVTEVAHITSPKLAAIVEFCLLWSDNVLADRLARTAANQLGFGTSNTGIQSAFAKTLDDYSIPSAGLVIKDGNGLSHDTRVTVRQIAELLLVIHQSPKFQVIYKGLPTSGETGTLKNRFTTDAPNAVGLVKAKTGTLSTTISLAGYVTVGPKQYVFAVVADHIQNRNADAAAAMTTIDKMLGTIAKPQS